ncbi:hypothetical protein [Modestobacter sp. URMC 112]
MLFAADPADETRVRQLVDEALAGGELTGPDGARASWRLLDSGRGSVRSEEERHGRRLARG